MDSSIFHNRIIIYILVACSFSLFVTDLLAGADCVESDNAWILSNDKLILKIAKGPQDIFIDSITFNDNSLQNLIAGQKRSRILWRIKLKSQGIIKTVTSSTWKCVPAVKTYKDGSKELSLVWADVDMSKIGVCVTCKIIPGDNLTYWRINIKNQTDKQLLQIDFPLVENIGPFSVDKKADKLIWPRVAGRLISNPYKNGVPSGYWDSFPYPSASQSMQFTAVYGDSGGIYFAAYDHECNLKRLQYDNDPKTDTLNYYLIHYPEDQSIAGNDFNMQYDAVIGLVKGDWWQAARTYSTWALKQQWCRGVNVWEDKNFPQRMKEVVVWGQQWYGIKRVERNSNRIHDFLKANMCTHWYEWNTKTHDTMYPEFFPARQGFKQAVQRLQEDDIAVMPYMNARLWDMATKSFKTKKVADYAIHDFKNHIVKENYNKHNFAVMCPYCKMWQDTITNICDILANEYGVEGIYIDQLGAAGPILCFDKSHGHKTGGGNYWAKGYWSMLDNIRKKVGKKVFLTTESFTESYINRIDGFLPWLAFCEDSIPLAQAVYGGRTIFWAYYFDRNDLKGDAFYVKTAIMLTNMVQPGWIYRWIMNDNAKEQRRFLFDVVLLYKKYLHKEAFLAGRLIESPVLNGVSKKVRSALAKPGGAIDIEVPAVMVGSWRCKNKILILLINVSRVTQDISVDLEKWSYGQQNNLKFDSATIYKSLEHQQEVKLGKTNKINISLLSHEPAVIELKD